MAPPMTHTPTGWNHVAITCYTLFGTLHCSRRVWRQNHILEWCLWSRLLSIKVLCFLCHTVIIPVCFRPLAYDHFYSVPIYNHSLKCSDCLSDTQSILKLHLSTTNLSDIEVRKIYDYFVHFHTLSGYLFTIWLRHHQVRCDAWFCIMVPGGILWYPISGYSSNPLYWPWSAVSQLYNASPFSTCHH